MNPNLRLLLVDDSEDDVHLVLHTLNRGGYDDIQWESVDTPAAMRVCLQRQDWDVIISDNSMPGFSARASLALAHEFRPKAPFIVVSSEIDVETIVTLLKTGASDFVPKKELPRLVTAVQRCLHDTEKEKEAQRSADALEVSETRYRRLFETALDGILIVDATTSQIDDVNPFLIEMLGYSREEFLGKKLWDLGSFKDVDASKQSFRELQTKGYVRYEDLPLLTNDGKRIDV